MIKTFNKIATKYFKCCTLTRHKIPLLNHALTKYSKQKPDRFSKDAKCLLIAKCYITSNMSESPSKVYRKVYL